MATTVAERVVPELIQDAAERGVSLENILQLLVRSVTTAYAAPEGRFKLAGLGGRLTLLAREGGCVDAKKAAAAYLGHNPKKELNAETVRRAAREKRLISIRDGHGDLLFPVWQFAEDGSGPLPGLSQVLKTLANRPGYSDITPFVFFLQPHPLTEGLPLAALRAGKVDRVVAAAESEAE
ncbi:MAG TPA: hypothetical protein VFT72_11300 [Opitutaceae bacterium]|nr:hypothetical protein [Opitutaceae bacterium]